METSWSGSAEERLWWAAGSRRVLTSHGSDVSQLVEYRPPARDSVSVPPHVLYITVGLVLVVLATYAIVGHLIHDLIHDLADWVFGPKTEAGDAERGDEEERVQMEEERAGLLPGFIITEHLHYITSL